jgi:predicted amidohydrolase YtcJ
LVLNALEGAKTFPAAMRGIPAHAAQDREPSQVCRLGGRQSLQELKTSSCSALKQVLHHNKPVAPQRDYFRLCGAGEYTVWAAGDFTNFTKDSLPQPPIMEERLTEVLRFVVSNGWPFRMHASFNFTAQRILGVVEKVHKDIPVDQLRWGLEHCEGMTARLWRREIRFACAAHSQGQPRLAGDQQVSGLRRTRLERNQGPPRRRDCQPIHANRIRGGRALVDAPLRLRSPVAERLHPACVDKTVLSQGRRYARRATE